MMISHSFDARRAGQIAAFFTKREGGLINVVKLIKLIYLADRQHMASYEEPMFMDSFVSMRLGPVNSGAYECFNSGAEGWDEFISDKADHNVALAKDFKSDDDLDALNIGQIDLAQIEAACDTAHQRYTIYHDLDPRPGDTLQADTTTKDRILRHIYIEATLERFPQIGCAFVAKILLCVDFNVIYRSLGTAGGVLACDHYIIDI